MSFGYMGCRGFGAALDQNKFVASTRVQNGITFWNDDVAAYQLTRIRQIKTGLIDTSVQGRPWIGLTGGNQDVGSWVDTQLSAGKCVIANIGVVFPDAIGTNDGLGFLISDFLIAVESPITSEVALATPRNPVLICSSQSVSVKSSWWSSASPTQKTIVVSGVAIIIGVLGYKILAETKEPQFDF